VLLQRRRSRECDYVSIKSGLCKISSFLRLHPSFQRPYSTRKPLTIMDSDEDWLDDAPTAHAGAHGDPLVDREWERITTRYSDVSPPSLSVSPYSLVLSGRIPRRHHRRQTNDPPRRLRLWLRSLRPRLPTPRKPPRPHRRARRVPSIPAFEYPTRRAPASCTRPPRRAIEGETDGCLAD
jgi:hypothetical protein